MGQGCASSRRPTVGLLVGRRLLRKLVPPYACIQPRVMPRGHKLSPDAVGIIEQLAELQPVVALDAGIRRPTARVFIDEVVDDLPEFGLQVERVKRNVEFVRHAAGVFRIAGRAAALFVIGPFVEDRQPKARWAIGGTSLLSLFAMPHEDADDVMPRLLEQPGGDARIDAAGHC